MNRIRSSGSAAGFTLVELLIAISLALVVVVGAGSVYLAVERSFQNGSRKLVAQQEATLLSVFLNRRIRAASDFTIYSVPNHAVPADSGNGLALFDQAGTPLGRLEWSPNVETIVDSTGARVTVLTLRDVVFVRDAANPLTVRYRYKADDERGNLVDIESGASLRNQH
jgi:prepilin-type N-terminal cleavage/methylation domain-containing protein